MMALQLKTGDATYYHHHHPHSAAEYCRNFTPPSAVSYGDSGHYLHRLPGAETLLKPPLSLFTHPQQPFQHLDPLPPLGPPPMGPTPGLCPPPLTPAPPLGPPVTLCPPPTATHTIRPPPLTAPPGHTLVHPPPPNIAPNPQLGPPPIPPHPLGPPPVVVDPTKTIPPPNIDIRSPPPSLRFPPAACLEPPQMPPTLVPAPVPVPVPGQAAPGGEQPHDEASPLGSEEQEDPLGLEELCKPLYCKLCNVTLNSTQQAQAHYQGKNHSKKLRNFYAGSQQPPAIRITDATETSGQTSNSSGASEGDATRQALFKGAARVILATENDYCKLCDASFSSAAVAQAHYQGKNHAKRLRLQEAHNNANISEGSSEVTPKRNRKDEYRLVKNRRSPQLPGSVTGPYYHSRPRQRIPRDLAMCVTPSGQFYCSMCNCGAEQEPDFRQHLESKQHKAKVSELRYRNEMVTLGYS
ncbi:zinc finger matrin-type protein 3 [Periophthalmus magnuspinnatus]|uniref:zinc finger matrin-type protein 3 n=1 Tax=Periophthalmus magnuspinnatus TaxID=409849 RepID=UPI002436D0A2|nr:zinc finger matrin-type protein 3 [Periophthalmus magnuspinnatus]